MRETRRGMVSVTDHNIIFDMLGMRMLHSQNLLHDILLISCPFFVSYHVVLLRGFDLKGSR